MAPVKEILFFTEAVEYPVFFSEIRVRQWLDLIAARYSRTIGCLSFIFCSDDYILDLNRKYLSHDYFTDVITFDYCEEDILSGDIFISLDTVRSNSLRFGSAYENEFHRVVCHGLLHLIGYKDKTEADSKTMRLNEDICLELLKTL